MIPDAHDPRRFRHFAKLNAQREVVAVVEVALGAPTPEENEHHLPKEQRTVYIEITEQFPRDLRGVTLPDHGRP